MAILFMGASTRFYSNYLDVSAMGVHNGRESIGDENGQEAKWSK